MTHLVTVSLVSHGQFDLCQRLVGRLNSLCAAHIEQIIITHNLPETRKIVSESIRVAAIQNIATKGFGANHNTALDRVSTPYSLIINPDIAFDDDFIATLLTEISAEPRLALISPSVKNSDSTWANFRRKLYTPREIWAQRKDPKPCEQTETAWIAGMCWLVRSKVFKNLNGFDEKFFMYCEDVDFCSRLILADWRLHSSPNAIVIHEAQRASHKALKYSLIHLQSALRLWTSQSFWRYRAKLQASSDKK